eukprot:Nk52_evm5s290 gene=Nk52_evmTU5s290
MDITGSFKYGISLPATLPTSLPASLTSGQYVAYSALSFSSALDNDSSTKYDVVMQAMAHGVALPLSQLVAVQSESALDSYCAEHSCIVGVVFSDGNSSSQGYGVPSWTYTMKQDYDVFYGDSDKRKVDVRSGSGMFGSNGLLTIQMTLDQAIAAYEKNQSLAYDELLSSVRWDNFTPETIQFTSKSQEEEDYENRKAFYNLVDSAGGCITALFFSTVVYFMVGELLTEKESRLQEAMLIMGLNASTYFFSWVLTAFAILVIPWILCAIILQAAIYTDTSMILFIILFVLAGISFIPLSLIMTNFFQKANTGTFASVLIVLGVAVGCQALYVATDLTTVAKGFLSLLSPGALLFGVLWINGRAFNRMTSSVGDMATDLDGYSILLAYIMLVVDIVLYFFISWYLKQVMPSQFGSPKRYDFILSSDFWKSLFSSKDRTQSSFESQGNCTVSLQGVTKEFIVHGQSTPLRAVDNLSFDIKEGHIMSFLGHNGAGKTTTFSMLTGMIPMTAGDAQIYGYSVNRQMDQIRCITGFCPQHDILWATLTVRETLNVYAALKGLPSNRIKDEVDMFIQESGLTAKQNTYTRDLSGGQKRKLSVSIAMIGDSKIVFLDEPTSGMDPHSRRAIWDIILKTKSNRTLMLSTHFMDEADILGDEIAILSHGKLTCHGSSLDLKAIHSNGYTITFVKNRDGHVDEDSIKKTILNRIPEGEEKDNNENEVTYSLPMGNTAIFPALLEDIETRMAQWNISSYGVTAPQLEDVFLNVAKQSNSTAKESRVEEKTSPLKGSRSKTLSIQDVSVPMEEIEFDANHRSGAFSQFRAMFTKRFLSACRNLYFTVYVFAFSMAVIGLGVYLARDYDSTCNFEEASNPENLLWEPSWTLPASDSSGATFISTTMPEIKNVKSFASNSLMMNYVENDTENLNGAFSASNISVGADIYSNYTAVYKVDERSTYALSSFNMIGNAFLRSITGNSNALISAFYKLFPSNDGIAPSGYNSSDGTWLLITIIVGFSYLLSNSIVFLVDEVGRRAKHQQKVSGVRTIPFWLANYAFDGLCLLILSVYTFLLLDISSSYYWHFWVATVCSFVLFALAALPFFYLWSFAFERGSAAQAGSYAYCIVCGIIWLDVFFALWFTRSVDVEIVNIWLAMAFGILCPVNSLLHCLMVISNIASLQCTTNPDLKPYDLFNFKGLLIDYIVLAGQAVVFPLIIAYLEKRKALAHQTFGNKVNVDNNEAFLQQLDDDVRAEHVSTESLGKDDAMVVIKNVRKEYPRSGNNKNSKVAVRNVSLNIRKGECFGLLGPNGAGKTSLLKTISGDIFPSAGDCYINGYSLAKDLASLQQSVGICPQFDALFDHLTVREHLYMYARARGISESVIEREVNSLIEKLDLGAHQFKQTSALSGGNKRKCSVAIALIGKPPVILLDEPSTGMDPAAKRFMWDVIHSLRKDHAIILTTHAMEECEALCTRIGIMVDGELRSMGSPQHLKSKFGDGYYLQMKLNSSRVPVLGDDSTAAKSIAEPLETHVMRELQKQIPSMVVTEKRTGQLNVHIPHSKDLPIGECFNIVEDRKAEWNIINYDITQTTLETIFLNFGALQNDLKADYSEDKKPMDTKHTEESPFDNYKNAGMNLLYATFGMGLIEAIITWTIALLLLLPIFTYKLSFRYFNLGWRFMTPYGRTRDPMDKPITGPIARRTGFNNIFRKVLAVFGFPFAAFASFIYLSFALVNCLTIVGFFFAKYKIDHVKMIFLAMKSGEPKQEQLKTEEESRV